MSLKNTQNFGKINSSCSFEILIGIGLQKNRKIDERMRKELLANTKLRKNIIQPLLGSNLPRNLPQPM